MTRFRRHLFELGVIGGGLFAGYCWASPADAATGLEPVPVATSVASAPDTAAATVPAAGMTRPAEARPVAGRAESPELAQLAQDEGELFPSGPVTAAAAKAQATPSLFLRDSTCGDGKDKPCLGERADWLEGLHMPDLPVRPDEDVRRYVRYFTETNHGRKMFQTWLRRSGKYRAAVSEALRERDLPQDLHALVFVESAYVPTAVSSAGAVGLWQLMPSTGKAYNLAIEPDYDERRSIKKASLAGARHLSDLYERFGSWDLAFAAYNMGYQGLLGRMKELGTQDYWELSQLPGALPRETALYVPKILAVAVVLRNLDRFGFEDVRAEVPTATSDLEVPPRTSLAVVARAAGTSLVKLQELNPELLRSTMPIRDHVAVHVPTAGLARARVMLPELVDPVDRDGLEQKVPATFDWGKDELPKHARKRPIFEEDTAQPAPPTTNDAAPAAPATTTVKPAKGKRAKG